MPTNLSDPTDAPQGQQHLHRGHVWQRRPCGDAAIPLHVAPDPQGQLEKIRVLQPTVDVVRSVETPSGGSPHGAVVTLATGKRRRKQERGKGSWSANE